MALIGVNAGRGVFKRTGLRLVRTRSSLPSGEPRFPTRPTGADSDAAYLLRAARLAVRMSKTGINASSSDLLNDVVQALEVERAVLITFVRNDALLASCRFVLACSAEWRQRYVDERCAISDPWLTYALHHTEPAVAPAPTTGGPAAQRAVALAKEYGFASTVVVPVHPAAGRSRIGVLCLGSSNPAFFSREGFDTFKVVARMLATELCACSLERGGPPGGPREN